MDCSLTHPHCFRVAWEMAMDNGLNALPNENFSPSYEDGLLLDAAETILKGIWYRETGEQLTEEQLRVVAKANEYTVAMADRAPLWELLCLGEAAGIEVIVESLGPAGTLLHEALNSMFDGNLSFMLNR